MNTIEILNKLVEEQYFFSFIYYDGLPYLYIKKYNDKYFMYFWITEEMDDKREEGINAFGIVELKFQDLNDILNKKYPIFHYYKTRETYIEKTTYRVGEKEAIKLEIDKYILNEEEWPVENFYLEELEDINAYVVGKKMKKF